jgi:dihydroxyacetone kinase
LRLPRKSDKRLGLSQFKGSSQYNLTPQGAKMAKVAIRTINGNYVTAVNGGGMGEAANLLPIHTDSINARGWEHFKINFQDSGFCTIQTLNGNYLTAVNGGGMGNRANTDPVHTDQIVIEAWERFELTEIANGVYTLQTETGNFVTAVGGGGMGEAANKLPLHTDATTASTWEQFILVPCEDPAISKEE